MSTDSLAGAMRSIMKREGGGGGFKLDLRSRDMFHFHDQQSHPGGLAVAADILSLQINDAVQHTMLVNEVPAAQSSRR